MDTFNCLVPTMTRLRQAGYIHDFNLQADNLFCLERQLTLRPQAFVVDDIHRFEGMTDPTDEAILYAISAPVFAFKGLLAKGYGLSADPITAEMEAPLRMVTPAGPL